MPAMMMSLYTLLEEQQLLPSHQKTFKKCFTLSLIPHSAKSRILPETVYG